MEAARAKAEGEAPHRKGGGRGGGVQVGNFQWFHTNEKKYWFFLHSRAKVELHRLWIEVLEAEIEEQEEEEEEEKRQQ